MSPQKSPAFSFYAKDFLTGTSTMSLQEVGAYVRLLAFQWDAGSVPEDASERARLLGCAKSQERDLWKKIGKKFVLSTQGYLNERLEEERFKQNERSNRLAANGKLGGRPRKADDKQNETNGFHVAKADDNQNKRLPSSSSFSSLKTHKDTSSPTTNHRAGALIVGGGEYVRLLETHAFVGQKLRVPKVLHAELVGKSGADADGILREWYQDLDAELESSGKGTGDVFVWLRPRHQAFAVERGWVDVAPKVNGEKRDTGASLEHLERIERGEIKR